MMTGTMTTRVTTSLRSSVLSLTAIHPPLLAPTAPPLPTATPPPCSKDELLRSAHNAEQQRHKVTT